MRSAKCLFTKSLLTNRSVNPISDLMPAREVHEVRENFDGGQREQRHGQTILFNSSLVGDLLFGVRENSVRSFAVGSTYLTNRKSVHEAITFEVTRTMRKVGLGVIKMHTYQNQDENVQNGQNCGEDRLDTKAEQLEGVQEVSEADPKITLVDIHALHMVHILIHDGDQNFRGSFHRTWRSEHERACETNLSREF